jgi:DNA invertase Pin-like site-specific DNA recombinase
MWNQGHHMMVGYARTSTMDQVAGYEDQIAHLTRLGVEKVFAEQASAVGERPQLAACLDFLQDGDVLIVTRLDRLWIWESTPAARRAGWWLRSSSPASSVACCWSGSGPASPRRRPKDGTRAEPRRLGGGLGEVLDLHRAGVRPDEIAVKLAISRSSVFRCLREARTTGSAAPGM